MRSALRHLIGFGLVLVLASIASCGAPKPITKVEKRVTKPPVTTPKVRQHTPVLPEKDDETLRLLADIDRATKLAESGDAEGAKRLLNADESQLASLPAEQRKRFLRLQATNAMQTGDLVDYLRSEQRLVTHEQEHKREDKNTEILMHLLSSSSVDRQKAASQLKNNVFAQGWLNLAIQLTNLPAGMSQQKIAVERWNTKYSGHSAQRYPPQQISAFFAENYEPDSFALMLPVEGGYARFGNALLDGFSLVMQHSYNANKKLVVHNVSNTAELRRAQQAIYENPAYVVGPLDRKLAQAAWNDGQINELLTLNYVNDQSGSGLRSQFGLAVEDEARVLARHVLSLPKARVAILVKNATQALRAQRAFSALVPHARVHRFSENKTINKTVTNIVGITERDIKRFKSDYASYKQKTAASSDGSAGLKNPLNRLLRKRRVDMLVLFADPVTAIQVRPLMNFYYASDIPILTTSQSYEISKYTNMEKAYEGMYIVDIPALGKKVQAWHEWVQKPLDMQKSFYRFYAMGIDAALLAVHSRRLMLSPGFRIRGTTGSLGYDTQTKRMTREPVLYRVNGGKLRRVQSVNNTIL